MGRTSKFGTRRSRLVLYDIALFGKCNREFPTAVYANEGLSSL